MTSQCFINVINQFPTSPEKKTHFAATYTPPAKLLRDAFSRKCAQGQDYFKQSSTRLHFIADRVIMFTQDAWQVGPLIFLGEGRGDVQGRKHHETDGHVQHLNKSSR